jgi:hypothetical protein
LFIPRKPSWAIAIFGENVLRYIQVSGSRCRMEEFLTSAVFRYGIFPIGSAALGVAIRYVSRNDQYATFSKEDIAVGLQLILTACLMLVTLTTDRALVLVQANKALEQALAQNPIDTIKANHLQAQARALSNQLATAGWLIAAMFLGLWSISTIVRKWGWKSATEMKPVIGIGLPLAFGVLALIVVMSRAAQ